MHTPLTWKHDIKAHAENFHSRTSHLGCGSLLLLLLLLLLLPLAALETNTPSKEKKKGGGVDGEWAVVGCCVGRRKEEKKKLHPSGALSFLGSCASKSSQSRFGFWYHIFLPKQESRARWFAVWCRCVCSAAFRLHVWAALSFVHACCWTYTHTDILARIRTQSCGFFSFCGALVSDVLHTSCAG